MTDPTDTQASAAPILRGRQLTRVFGEGATRVEACSGVDVDVRQGELVVIRGRSGSGKTTLLNLLAAVDRPTSGSVWLGELELSAATEDELVRVRRDRIGFVFQGFGLIPVLSATENVELPLRLLGVPADERDERVARALEDVGLTGHAAQRPPEMSGGQQQRVGIARAIVSEPEVLFADEPTGQLDSMTAAATMDLLVTLVRQRGTAAVVTTHDPLLVARADRVLELHDGRVVDETHPAAG
ncbi:ABC transporter ATP-binding protein [Humibacter sp.]|jgi:putative ABC transport system ATP-binding protein|uniref:ABC transporter ATP-binding protein n=1 Tax=Humibacter sp. TaxID=1940291 RepID=UPI002CB8486E|nr:ABC transporter ATP-binding protein [Humibacter sp.]HVX06888.1 ABC transporter ATP-binding protein [Humibacter sp.]